jgi:hypothetical protein
MTTRIERHRRNELFEITRLDSVSEEEFQDGLGLTEAEPPHGWIAKPKHQQGFEMRYWRHHGGRAFDLRLRCYFLSSEKANSIIIDDRELEPLVQFLDKALGYARSWPLHGTHVHLQAVTCMIMSLTSHAESLQMLFDMLVSQIEVETIKLR